MTFSRLFGAGKAAADYRAVVVDAAAVTDQKFTAKFNHQIIVAIQGKFKPLCPQLFEGGILFGSQLYAGEAAATGGVTAGAMLVSIFRVIQQDAMQLFLIALKKGHNQLLLR
jgi:hypothetical protein